MLDELAKERAFIDLILFSPYHPKGTVPPYNIDHISRKPKSGMFFEALHSFPIKASCSYMIGDKESDLEFGKNNGLTTILVKTGYGSKLWQDRNHKTILPDFVVENLFYAAKLVFSIERP